MLYFGHSPGYIGFTGCCDIIAKITCGFYCTQKRPIYLNTQFNDYVFNSCLVILYADLPINTMILPLHFSSFVLCTMKKKQIQAYIFTFCNLRTRKLISNIHCYLSHILYTKSSKNQFRHRHVQFRGIYIYIYILSYSA